MGNADIHRGADTNALIAPRVITGAINGPAFDTCIETQPAPALDPIEMAFAKLKAHLRRIGAGTFDALFEALGNTCSRHLAISVIYLTRRSAGNS